LIVRVNFNASIKFSLNPEQFNLLMQCIHLNLTYTDGLSEYFQFGHIKQRKQIDTLRIAAYVNCQEAALQLYDTFKDDLLSISARQLLVETLMFANSLKTSISANNVLIHDSDINGKKSPMLYSKTLENDKTGNFSLIIDQSQQIKDEKALNVNKWKITVKNQVFVFKMNTLYSLLQMISVSMPNYELLPDKPNRYDSVPSVMSFHLELNESTMLVAGEQNLHALALEGQFLVNFEQNGLDDIMGETLIYVNTGAKNPYKSLRVALKNTTAFFCVWSKIPQDGLFSLNECSKRLLIENMKLIEYLQTETAEMNHLTKTFDDILTRIVNVSGITTTITYLDLIEILCMLEHHLEHLSRDYYYKLQKYYITQVPNLTKILELKGEYEYFVYNKCYKLKPSELSLEGNNALNYFFKQNEKLESMRQELLIINNVKASLLGKKEKQESEIPKQRLTAKLINRKTFFELNIPTDLNLILINQFQGIFNPLFFIKMQDSHYKYSVLNKNTNDSSFSSLLAINYYNGEASTWEPLLEPFILNLAQSKKGSQEQNKIIIPKQINLNVTSVMVNMLQDCWKFLNDAQPAEKKKENERFVMIHKSNSLPHEESALHLDFSAISSYAIDNQSGETITCTILDLPKPQKIIIKPHEVVNLCTEPSEEVKAYSLINRRTFWVKFDFDPSLKIAFNEKVNLALAAEFHKKTANGAFKFSNKTIKMRKIFTIKTSYQITNEMELPIMAVFKLNDKETKKFLIEPNKGNLSIPLYLIKLPYLLCLPGCEDTLKAPFSISQLKEKFTNPRSIIQISVGNKSYAILTNQQSADGLHLTVWAPFKVQNCLPVDLAVKFTGHNDIVKLKPTMGSYVYSQSVAQEGAIEITLPRFNKKILEYRLDKVDYPLKLKDEAGNEVAIHLKVLTNNKARYLFVFYAECAIRNFTDDNLIFFAVTVF